VPDPIATRCLRLAWEGWCAGTLPVGAVVTDAAGTVVAADRGRMFGSAPAAGRLAGCAIAHAEINALAQLPIAGQRPDHTLHVSLEPCLMCVGAAGMAALGRLRFLGADPYAGASRHYRRTPYLDELPLQLDGPVRGAAGALGSALHLAYYLRTEPDAPAVAVHRLLLPELFDLARRVVALDARQPDAAAAGLFDLVAEPPAGQHGGTRGPGGQHGGSGYPAVGEHAAGEEAGRR
jgi:tRNA(Arg) A34 adenosine deaminase TadA